MTSAERDDLRCDLLLFIATPTEEKKLGQNAGRFGVEFAQRTVAVKNV
jgi:hypothetical protein